MVYWISIQQVARSYANMNANIAPCLLHVQIGISLPYQPRNVIIVSVVFAPKLLQL